MKKQIIAFACATAVFMSSTLAAHNPFIKLTNTISQSADLWITDVASLLSQEDALLLLNLFVDPSTVSMEATLKCIEEIQIRTSLEPALEELQKTIQIIVEKYATSMQKKFNQHKAVPTKEDMKEFATKLEQKIYELVHYFNQIYYQKLYTHLAQENPTKLQFMFDEQGIITPENRTHALPAPSA